MALTATYSTDLGRIRLAGDTLGASATYAVFDRTTDGITYTTVRGGTHVTVTGAAAHIDDYEFPPGVAITYRVRSYSAGNVLQATFTVSITQALTDPWLKSLTRPFLNQLVTAADASDVVHTSRAKIFPIVGRSNPVAVTDVVAQHTYDLTLTTFTEGEADELRYLATSGDIVFLHVPAGFPAPGGYYAVGDTKESRQGMPWDRRWFTLTLNQVAAPGPDVIPTTYTWSSVLADYATWADVIAANATWAALLERVGSPEDVIVP